MFKQNQFIIKIELSINRYRNKSIIQMIISNQSKFNLTLKLVKFSDLECSSRRDLM